MVFTALGTAIAGAFFAGNVIAAQVIAFGLSVGAQALLSKRSEPPKHTYSAVQSQTQFGADSAANVVYGVSKVKGQRIYYAKYGSGNKFNSEVFVLADGWNTGLEKEIYFYGKKHVLTSQSPVGNETERYNVAGYGSNITIRFFDGNPDQLADSELVSKTSALADPWTQSDIVANQCYVSVDRTYNKKQFSNGKPDFSFILKGLKEYDPRFDGTVGGSGSQRLSNISTWGDATQNPAIHRLNYNLGQRGLVSNRVRVGVGLNINQIDVTAHINAANICDTQRIKDGRTIQTYQCSMIVSAENDHISTLQAFEDAMAGYGGMIGGVSSCIAGAPQIPVYEITNDDIRLDAKSVYRPKRSAFDTVNVLSGQFTSKESFWNAESLKTIKVNAHVAADGAQNQDVFDLLQVTDPDVAQYVLNIRYRQKRKVARRTIPVSRKCGFAAVEGRWVTYKGKSWLVEKRSFDDLLRFTLVLSETGSDIYSENGIEPGPIVFTPTVPANPSLLSAVQNFNIESGFLESENGQKIPHLKFTWTPPEDPTITGVIINYAVEGDNTYHIAEAPDAEAGELIIATNLVAGSNYQAFATIRTVPDRFTTDSPIVGTSIPVLPISILLAQMQDDTKSVLQRLRADVNLSLSTGVDALTPILMQTANDFKSRQVVKRQVNSARAAITKLQELRVDDNEAFASQLNLVGAGVGDATADGFLKFEQVATPVGADSEIALFAKAELGDTLEQAGLIIASNVDANGGGSSVYLVGDKVAVIDSLGNIISLFNADGQILQGRLAVDSVITENIATGTITANEVEINGLTGNVSQTASDTDVFESTSSSYKDVPSFVKTITTAANTSILIMFAANVSHTAYGNADVRCLVNGAEFPRAGYRSTSTKSGSGSHVSSAAIVGVASLPAGTHTVKIQFRRRFGSGSKALLSRSLVMYQFKR